MRDPVPVARLPLGTSAGEFDLHAFEGSSGNVYLAMVRGIDDGVSVPTRVHSECLTGDALGSLRCDCGPQLRAALRAIAAEERGVVLYVTGHEGRGIGLINKLRAYMAQDQGADTVQANRILGLPVDDRDYAEAAACLRLLGIRSVRLLSNNPRKAAGLAAAGIPVDEVVPLPTAAHVRSMGYLRTKERRLAHVAPLGSPLGDGIGPVIDVTPLLGEVRTPDDRPFVVLKYAQTLDGRIATRTGDSKWISGDAERRMSHALRAACDAVLVGIGTVLADDPRLTVRMAPGSSPIRVVLDRSLRIPARAGVLGTDAPTILVCGPGVDEARRRALRGRGVGVIEAAATAAGVDLGQTLRELRARGILSVLVEGGARVITSFLAAGLVDRLIVSLAPTVMGSGTEAVGELNVTRVSEAVTLLDRSVHRAGDDLVVAGTVAPAPRPVAPAAAGREVSV